MHLPRSRSLLARRRLLQAGTALAMPAAGAACAFPERGAAVPRESYARATALGLPNERFFFLSNPAAVDAEFQAASQREIAWRGLRPGQVAPIVELMAVSGGGEDGAYGAGLLCGWTEQGTRPVFNLVTGVSTGALTAPFAFLGPKYDPALRDVYTQISLADIAESRSLLLAAIWEDALSDTKPLFRTISRHLNEAMLADLARAYDEGRILLIGTTNLDAQLPVVWNIGAIAKHGVTANDPRALDLIRRILLASSAVPGAFPPVMLDVELDGRKYQEMHVDGGAFAQAFLYPSAVSQAREARRRAGVRVREARVWVIRNARLDPGWASVDRRTLGIVGRAISTMIFASGGNDVARMYNSAQRDGLDYNLAYISPDFTTELTEPFDQKYMRALFEYGYAQGRAGYRWAKQPPFLGTRPAGS
jgi:predicted acylesterase/phospholipase RssA